MLKVGLIGAGGMGGVHRGIYKGLDDVKLTAIADVRTEIAAEKAADDSIKIYADYKEMIEKEDLDYVDICTPSYMHADMAIYALEHGLHVLCEKPMVLHSADGERVIAAAEKSGKFFMTAHVVRFMNPYIYLRGIIKSRELGNPTHLLMSRISSIPQWSWEDWMRCKEKSGLVPIDLHIHDVDFMQHIFGMPKAVSATYHELKDGSDYIVSNYVYDGFAVTAEGTWYKAAIPFCASYRAVFENGTVIFDGQTVRKNGEAVDLGTAESADTGINISSVDGYGGEIRYFADCIIAGKAPEAVTPQSSLDSVKLIEKTLEGCIRV